MNQGRSIQFLRWFAALCWTAALFPFPTLAHPNWDTTDAQDAVLLVDTFADRNDPAHQACTDQPDDCSLRGAISRANTYPGHYYQIILPAGTYGLIIPGVKEDANLTGDLDVYASLSITGSGPDLTVIDGVGLDRVLDIYPGASVTIQALTITGGKTQDGEEGYPAGTASEPGGGIYNRGSLRLIGTTLTVNYTGAGGDGADKWDHGGASGDGGGIYNAGWLFLDYAVLLDNGTGQAGGGCPGGKSGDGGGIYNAGQAWLKDSQFTRNFGRVGGYGSWIWTWESCAWGAGSSGGGAYNRGELHVQRSSFVENESGADGGGLFNSNWLEIEDSQIQSNDSYRDGWVMGGHGGGIYNTGWLDLKTSQVIGNRTGPGRSGGGIASSGQARLSDSRVEGNQAGKGDDGGYLRKSEEGGYGGGISNSGSLLLINTSVINNRSGDGGNSECCNAQGGDGGSGGGLNNSGTAELWNSPVIGNLSGNGGYYFGGTGGTGGTGGGIYNGGDLLLASSPVISNTAGQGGQSGVPGQGGAGGGIYNSGQLQTRFSSVKGNTAGAGGAGSPDTIRKGGDGGGIYNAGSLDLLGGQVLNNRAGPGSLGGDGGGIFVSTAGSLTLNSAILADNWAEPGGVGSGMVVLGSASLNHTTLARNTGGDGSGIYFNGTSLDLSNTILVSHTVGITTTGNYTHLDHTLWGSGVWANLADWGGSGTHTSTQEIYADPAFVDPDGGDYHILPSSPAVNAGLPSPVYVDVDNQPRPNPPTSPPDLGADEVWAMIPIGQVSIAAPEAIYVSFPVTVTASVSPTNATPNLVFLWSPHPERGQGTDTAVYRLLQTSAFTITVTAWNAGGSAIGSRQVEGIFGPGSVFLPSVTRFAAH